MIVFPNETKISHFKNLKKKIAIYSSISSDENKKVSKSGCGNSGGKSKYF